MVRCRLFIYLQLNKTDNPTAVTAFLLLPLFVMLVMKCTWESFGEEKILMNPVFLIWFWHKFSKIKINASFKDKIRSWKCPIPIWDHIVYSQTGHVSLAREATQSQQLPTLASYCLETSTKEFVSNTAWHCQGTTTKHRTGLVLLGGLFFCLQCNMISVSLKSECEEQSRTKQTWSIFLLSPSSSDVLHCLSPKLAEGHSCNRCKEAEFTLTGLSKANWVCGGHQEWWHW